MTDNPRLDIEYMEQNIDDVVAQYTDGFVPSPGTTIVYTEWFIDIIKKKIIFKLFTKTKGE